jgi:hypothetical protein
MTDEQTPAPIPSSDPPPLAPLVEQASANSSPEPTPPTMAAPTMAAPAAPPPPVAWGAPPVVAAAKGERTMLAAVAGVGMIILGVLGGLFGLAIAVFGSSVVKSLDLSQFGDLNNTNINDPAALISGAIAFVGIVVVVYSLVYLIGGIGVVRSRGWGRVMGVIVGILSGLFWLAGLTGGRSDGLGFALVMVAIHAYIVVALLVFWRRKTA